MAPDGGNWLDVRAVGSSVGFTLPSYDYDLTVPSVRRLCSIEEILQTRNEGSNVGMMERDPCI